MRFFIVIAAVALSVPLNATPAGPRIVFDANGNVTRFYGVPIDLSISGLKRLPYRVTMGQIYVEGDEYVTAKIDADRGVRVEVTFGSDGKLYDAESVSPEALGPRGMGVGSMLSKVRAAWPNGRLLYGVEEGKAFVVFITGTNVMYQFAPEDMPPRTFFDRGSVKDVPDIPVQSIRLSKLVVSVPTACVPGYCL